VASIGARLGRNFSLVFLFCSRIIMPVSQHLKESVMNSVISATILCFAIGTGAAYAQASAAPATPGIPATAAVPAAAPASPPAATAAPAVKAMTAKPKLSPDDKKKLSQECSAQANDKKLHGKDRRTFRATCIRQGGVPA
jgi:hypothetical protein